MANLVNIDVGGITAGLFDLVDKLFVTDEDRSNAKLRLIELQQKGELAQIAVNAAEAQHESVFVSGWRPAIGWICGAAFLFNFVVQPLLTFILIAVGPMVGFEFPVSLLPALDMGTIMAVLGGILGLGGFRTYEKYTGTNTNRQQPGSGGTY